MVVQFSGSPTSSLLQLQLQLQLLQPTSSTAAFLKEVSRVEWSADDAVAHMPLVEISNIKRVVCMLM